MPRKQIAEVLKLKRKEVALSVDGVSAKLKDYGISISPKALYNYETGFRQPDVDTLMALCEIYQITDILVAFGYKSKKKPDHMSMDELDINDIIVARTYHDAGDGIQCSVRKLLDLKTEDEVEVTVPEKKLSAG